MEREAGLDVLQHPFAAKGRGNRRPAQERRAAVVLPGRPSATTQPFDVASLKGKPVLVVYWASWPGGEEDAKQVAELAKDLRREGLAIVTVC